MTGGKAKAISRMGIHRMIPIKVEGNTHYLTLVEVHYVQHTQELYFLPLSFVSTESIINKVEYHVQSVVCRADIQDEQGFVIDSCYDKQFRDYLLSGMEKKVNIKLDDGTLEFNASVFNKITFDDEIDSRVLKADQSNTAIIYNDRYFFKFYRKLEKEINPDLEIVRFLSETTSFTNSPKYTGSIELAHADGKDRKSVV